MEKYFYKAAINQLITFWLELSAYNPSFPTYPSKLKPYNSNLRFS